MVLPKTAFLVVVACLATGFAADVTPIQKVLQMLEEAKAKGFEEKHIEEVEFAKFKVFCDETREETTESISEGKEKIVQLEADIDKAESDAAVLTGEIADLEGEIARIEGEIKSATEVRTKEKAEFEAIHLDYSESIDAIERAIAVLKAKSADVPQSLVEVRSSKAIPARAKAAIESFLALGSAVSEETAAPEANAYEFQSGGVIELLEKLLKKFEDQTLALEKAELNNQGNYDLLMQQLTDDLKRDKEVLADKQAMKATRLEDAAEAKADLEVTKKQLAEDEKALADLNTECAAKSQEYEKNQVVRAAELEAIKKAIEIISSDAVSGAGEKHLPQFQQVSATTLSQLRSSQKEDPDVRQKVMSYLQGRAQKLGSRYLSLVAARAADDPFKKVKKMIKDLIVKLMEEANAEADKKGFCDAELATNKQTREIKQAEADELSAEIEKGTALSAQLATEISDLSEAIAQLKKAMAEATELRAEEKEKNAAIVGDAKEAQTAVEAAIKVLKDFYDNPTGAALLQSMNQAASLAQEMKAASKEPYTGMQSESGGIIGMLEVILSDFARLQTDTETAEDEAETAYTKFMNESEEDEAVKTTTMKHLEAKKQRTDEAVAQAKKELELTQEELDAALAYFEKLKPDCLDTGLSYEERVRKRKEEIVSLQEAYKILDGEEVAM